MICCSAAVVLATLLAAGEVPAPAAPDAAASGGGTEAAPAKEPIGALIRRSMAAYGGDRARVRLGQVRATGKVKSSLHPGEVGRLVRVYARSSRLRLDVAFPGSPPEVRVLDGARAFRYGKPAPPAVATLLQLQAARLDLPTLLLEWESRVVDQGEVTHEGQALRVLGLEVVTGQRIEAGVDPRSGRILYVRGLARAGPRQLEVFTVYRDFRTVDGVLVPFHEEGWANGEPTGDVDLTVVEFLDAVPDDAFEP